MVMEGSMDNREKVLSMGVILQVLIFVVGVPFLPLLISWDWGWWQAWVFGLLSVCGFAVSRALAGRRHPDLLAERAKFLRHADAKPWDKVLAPLVGLGGGLIPLVAGLEARFGSSSGFGLETELVSLVLILAGYVFSSWALMENRFFSGMVRIQKERGHQVVSSGPYRWVRHPGYAGALLTYLFTPILLDSYWAYIPVALLTVVLVIRTSLEDRTLQQELPGYADYAQRTRDRLLPGIW
jgi:protein-S-isoprenylcysteine O-methyltransferase Ste14